MINRQEPPCRGPAAYIKSSIQKSARKGGGITALETLTRAKIRRYIMLENLGEIWYNFSILYEKMQGCVSLS